jgi:2-polyprenyl-3-methyl-5-hydroxy-6-metoxy-1,4-benzoquinol methylase
VPGIKNTPRSPKSWQHLPCPVCEGSSFTKLFEKGGEPFVRCNGCTLVMINPRPVYADIIHTYIHGYSAGYIDKKDKKIRRAKRMVRRLSRVVPRGCWLDIGCSAGFTLRVAREAGFDAYGVEVDPLGVKYATEVFGLKNVAVGSFEEQRYPDEFFDVITVVEVIEHVPNLNNFCSELKRTLSRTGIIYLTTPDVAHWRTPKPLHRWEAILPSQHLYYFSKTTLQRLLEKHGLKIVKKRFNLKPGLQVIVTHADAEARK